jgi:hypothetical protein
MSNRGNSRMGLRRLAFMLFRRVPQGWLGRTAPFRITSDGMEGAVARLIRPQSTNGGTSRIHSRAVVPHNEMDPGRLGRGSSFAARSVLVWDRDDMGRVPRRSFSPLVVELLMANGAVVTPGRFFFQWSDNDGIRLPGPVILAAEPRPDDPDIRVTKVLTRTFTPELCRGGSRTVHVVIAERRREPSGSR